MTKRASRKAAIDREKEFELFSSEFRVQLAEAARRTEDADLAISYVASRAGEHFAKREFAVFDKPLIVRSYDEGGRSPEFPDLTSFEGWLIEEGRRVDVNLALRKLMLAAFANPTSEENAALSKLALNVNVNVKIRMGAAEAMTDRGMLMRAYGELAKLVTSARTIGDLGEDTASFLVSMSMLKRMAELGLIPQGGEGK